MQQRVFGEASLGSLSMTLPSMPRSVLCGHTWQRMGDISRAISFLVPAHQKTQVFVLSSLFENGRLMICVKALSTQLLKCSVPFLGVVTQVS